MGLFSASKPKRITSEEFKAVMTRLYGKFDEDERVEVEKLFRADLNEPGMESGITQIEFDSAITWLNQNTSKHVLEDDDIALLVQYFEEHLKD
jgi:truncated hemoglobin YjbI